MRKTIRWRTLRGALIAAMLIAGFGQAGHAEMRIAWQSADVQTLLSLADKTGIFEEEGLEYSLRSFPSGGTILPAMAAKEVDIGWMGEFAALTGFTNGIPLEVIMVEQDWPSYLRVIVQPESGITDITELKGAKIGMAFGSPGHNHALLMLERAGLTAADVTLINLQPAQLTCGDARKTDRCCCHMGDQCWPHRASGWHSHCYERISGRLAHRHLDRSEGVRAGQSGGDTEVSSWLE